MERETKEKKASKSRGKTFGIMIAFGLVVLLVACMKYFQMNEGPFQYKIGEVAFEFTGTKAEYTGLNSNQIIRITKDGITAYNLKGEEIWMDTLTLDKIIVKQKDPYFVVGNQRERKLSIFSDKGKEGDIYTDAPIVYFSINKNGDVATIEETKDGHMINAYTKNGTWIPGRRVTHIESAGFPIAATVSPDRSMLIASYVDIYNPFVTSVLVGIKLDVKEEEAVDNIEFLIEERNNLLYELTYINDSTWVGIGDSSINYYDQKGKTLKEIDGYYLKYTPYVLNNKGSGSVALITSSIKGEQTVFGKQKLVMLNQAGEVGFEKSFDQGITYFKADDKGVTIGEGKDFTRFDLKGEVKYSFHATQDIIDVGIVNRQPIAITRNQVVLLEKVEVEQ